MQIIAQSKTKKLRDYKATCMRNMNVPKNNLILRPLKTCCCYESIIDIFVT